MSDFRIDCINALYRWGMPALWLTEFSDLSFLAEGVAYDYKTPFARLLIERPLLALRELAEACEAWAD